MSSVCAKNHAALKTSFCPDCGVHLHPHGADGLKVYLSVQVRARHRELQESCEELETSSPYPGWTDEQWKEDRRARVDRRTRNLARWQSWLGALEKFMESSK